jgi:hypothetical protein
MSGEQGAGEGRVGRSAVVSPAELLMIFLNEMMDVEIVPGGAVVGGATDPQQQAGCVSIMDAGDTKRELYAPLLWKRCQLRCMAPTLAKADAIGMHVEDLLNDQQNLEIDDALGRKWFVHGIYVATGTSHHVDSNETQENLLFANVTVGRDQIPQ